MEDLRLLRNNWQDFLIGILSVGVLTSSIPLAIIIGSYLK